MTRRKSEDAEVRFSCSITCAATPWEVEGRFNAEGEFEPFDAEALDCPECGEPAAPIDDDVRVA